MPRGKVLVVGAAGFLGATLCKHLQERNIPFRGFDISSPRSALKIAEDDWVSGSFLDDEALSEALDGCEQICHLACTSIPATSNESPMQDCADNLLGTLHLLEKAKEYEIRNIVFLSSGGTVYGPDVTSPISEDSPTSPICSYGIHKLAIEKYLELYRRLYGLQYQVLRVSNPYGEFQDVNRPQGAIAVFLNRALADKAIDIWGDGTVVRDYIHADDVATAIELALGVEGRSGIFNIGSGTGVSLNDLLRTLNTILGKDIIVNYQASRNVDVQENVLKIDRARNILGWVPKIELMDGVTSLVKFHSNIV